MLFSDPKAMLRPLQESLKQTTKQSARVRMKAVADRAKMALSVRRLEADSKRFISQVDAPNMPDSYRYGITASEGGDHWYSINTKRLDPNNIKKVSEIPAPHESISVDWNPDKTYRVKLFDVQGEVIKREKRIKAFGDDIQEMHASDAFAILPGDGNDHEYAIYRRVREGATTKL